MTLLVENRNMEIDCSAAFIAVFVALPNLHNLFSESDTEEHVQISNRNSIRLNMYDILVCIIFL